MIHVQKWLDRLRSKQTPAPTYAEQRRNEALELLRNAEDKDSWLELSTHYNGFIREVAVRELCNQQSPEALVALIDRLNDWIPQVRNLALTGLNRYMSTSQVQALLFALEHFIPLATRQRVDHSPTISAIREVLQSPEAHDAVYTHFLTSHGKSARYLFELMQEKNSAPEKLLRSALSHRELTVRLLAVSACQELPASQASSLLLEALSQPAAKVQVCVLRALLPLLDDPTPLLRTALLNPSPSIRNLARWAAPRNNVDTLAVLSERVNQGIPKESRDWLGVLGLAAELNSELDKQWLRKALGSHSSRVRYAAVRLLSDSQLPDLLRMLDDPSEKVFHSVITVLRTQPWASVCLELTTKLDQDWRNLPAARSQAILQLIPGWQQLAYLLKRLDTEPALKAFWLRYIDQWCDRQYQVVDPITPKSEREALVEKLQTLADTGLVRKDSIARIAR